MLGLGEGLFMLTDREWEHERGVTWRAAWGLPTGSGNGERASAPLDTGTRERPLDSCVSKLTESVSGWVGWFGHEATLQARTA